jgi:hypothetical protein
MAQSEASVSMTKGWSGTQCDRIGAEMKASLRNSKDIRLSSVKAHGIPFRVSQVRGTVISE